MLVKNADVDLAYEMNLRPLWRQAFRPFFLAGSIFSVIALIIWVGSLTGTIKFSPYGHLFFWHAHEMLFGFVGAIITGFLLTAVQNWTGFRSTHGSALKLVFGLWLAARILMAINIASLQWLTALIDLAFFPMVAFFMAQLVLASKNYRNLFFVPVLGLLAASNFATHWSLYRPQSQFFEWGLYSAILLSTLLMVVIGGRVIPMFTAGGTKTVKTAPLAWLEYTVLGSMWLIVALYLTRINNYLPQSVVALVFTVAAAANTYRALRWRPWITFNTPIVWSLHVAYWFIPVGLALFALHLIDPKVSISAATHALTAGAMSSLILSMISRVALGHSGRPLTPHRLMTYAFIAISLAGLLRVSIALYPVMIGNYGYVLTAALWATAYGIFVMTYFRILTAPRADGRPG